MLRWQLQSSKSIPKRTYSQYERGWPSYKNADVRKSNRGVRICVRKLAANSSVCGVSEFTSLTLQRVTKVVKLASIFFNEHPESLESSAIKLQECAVIASYFFFVRAARTLLRLSSLKFGGVGINDSEDRRIFSDLRQFQSTDFTSEHGEQVLFSARNR